MGAPSTSSLVATATSMLISTTASAVSSATATAMSMAASSTSSMDMDMDMGTTTSSASSSAASTMDMSSSSMSSMTFHSNIADYILSTGWTPDNRGQYVGTCIFLIVLAIIYRATHVIKHRTERYLISRALVKSVPVVLGEDSDVEKYVAASASGSLAAPDSQRLPSRPFDFTHARPWRVSIDIPLSVIQFFLSGISYLLMLAAMTFNLGYFFSILGGIFIGELLLGRFASSFEAH
ncbi:Ctr copper transporter family-domain-containing protein [Kockiozyma suomiensis]|uniref:Ctr copper transporter family-domain-containing protein n=1 Tax=Kockiozyma suomiensis TaxID=1337062 RepID=UPI003343FD6F